MYTMCVTEKTAEQQHIFEQTFLQMLLENYYDEITISDLCRRAGLSRKIFYRLFEKKQDVFYSLIDHALIQAGSFQPDPSVGPGELHRLFAFWKSQKDLLDALLKHQSSSLLTERAVRHVLKEDSLMLHTFGADTGSFGKETMLFYLSGIFSLVLVWHSNGYDHSIDEMSTLLMNLLSTAGIKNPVNLKTNNSRPE